MRRRIAPRPSPAMGVAFLALLIALSGSAIALPGKGTVDSGDVKNNSVRSKDVRNSTVRGIDVAGNTLTGQDVNEPTLAKVPSAGSADSATTADSAKKAASADNFGSYKRVKIAQFSLGDGEQRTLLTHGPFTLRATCDIVPAGNDTAAIVITTNADNQALNADDVEADFDQAESPLNFIESAGPTGTATYDHADDGSASSAGGNQLLGDALWAGTNLYGTTQSCWFGGFAELG